MRKSIKASDRGRFGANVPQPSALAKRLSSPCHCGVAALQQRPGTITPTPNPPPNRRAAEAAAQKQEAAMPQAVPTQHPAVVLRSHYRQLRALLAIAMIAVVGLTVTVVILAEDEATSTRPATPASAPTEPAGPRYIHPPGQRYDPGPHGTIPSQPRKSVPLPARKLDGSTDGLPTRKGWTAVP
jgi:hypothetical protein